ncbi:MAG: Type prenyl endopeptidase Rce1-like [Pseudomonadota bacterium]
MGRRNSFVLKRLVLGLFFAFLSVKAGKEWMSGDTLRHLFLACALVGIASLLRLPKIVSNQGNDKARGRWFADVVCLVYGLAPFLLNALFKPMHWMTTLADTASWLTSSSGIFSVFLAPVVEEYFFRGWLLNGQRTLYEPPQSETESTGSRWLMLCYTNALFFWALHAPFDWSVWKLALSDGKMPMSLGPFFLGLVTCALTLFSGSLRPAIVFHLLANALGPVWQPLLSSETLRSVFYN